MNSNQVNQQLYIKELNDEIDKMLSEKGLTKNETNIELIQKIIKQKKEIALEIRIHEKKFNELKVKNPKTQFEEREHIITYCCTSGGMLGGIVIGAKVGLAIGGIYGATIGGIIGGCIGIFSGHLGGQALNKATLSEDDIKNAQEEIQNEINAEQDIINELKTKLQNL